MTHTDQDTRDHNQNMLLEAVLFMHGAPITLARLEEIMTCSRQDVEDEVEKLKLSYEERQAGLRVLVVNGSVQIVTHPDAAEVIEKFKRRDLEGQLSQAALEVLAIIAYRGPLSKPDIEAVRGVNCSFTLRNLLLRGLIERIPHPTDQRLKLYTPTMDMVRSLGYSSLEELPAYEELVSDKRIDAVLYGGADDDRENDDDIKKG